MNVYVVDFCFGFVVFVDDFVKGYVKCIGVVIWVLFIEGENVFVVIFGFKFFVICYFDVIVGNKNGDFFDIGC